jgi:hypothetical protein
VLHSTTEVGTPSQYLLLNKYPFNPMLENMDNTAFWLPSDGDPRL